VSRVDQPSTPATDEQVRELGFEPSAKGWRPLTKDVHTAMVQADFARTTADKDPGPANVVAIPDLSWRQRNRWSAVTLEGALALPEGTMKAWEVAVRLGRVMRTDGTFERLRNVDDALCVVVSRVQRDRTLALISRTRRTWERDVSAWVAVRMAHRCPGHSVVLFLSPRKVCPACGYGLEGSDT
jgi:hypothetical protein